MALPRRASRTRRCLDARRGRDAASARVEDETLCAEGSPKPQAAPDGVFAREGSGRRVTLLVNVWLDWRPEDADELPAAARAQLQAPREALDFRRERRIQALPMATAENKPRSWTFEAGAHPTKVSLRLPKRLGGDAPDACVLFQGGDGPPLVEVASHKK